MNTQTPELPEYIHGSSAEEQRRLSLLNEILNEACLAELNLKPGERVVDFGSGLGQFTRVIARSVGLEGQVIGIERDPDQIAAARACAQDDQEAGLVEFRLGDGLDPPLHEPEWGSFDLAHARFLLEHVSHPARVIKNMARSLRPGGRILVIDDDHGNFRPWPEPQGFAALWDAYVQSFDRLGNDPYVGRRLVSLLHDAGLRSLRNSFVFFGGCAPNERFQAIADNLITAILGAKDRILTENLLDEPSFLAGIDGLLTWKAHPSAALWYAACCAEGILERAPD